MLKKLIVAVLSVILAATMMAGCGDKKDESSGSKTDSGSSAGDVSPVSEDELGGSLTIDGKDIDTKDVVMMTIGDSKISFAEYRRYFLGMKAQYIASYGEISSDKDLKTLKSYVEDYLVQNYTIIQTCKDENVYDAPEDQSTIDSQFDAAVSSYGGEDGFNALLSSNYLTHDQYRQYLVEQVAYTKLQALYAEGGSKYTDAAALKKKMQTDEFAIVTHILIPYESQAEIAKDDLSSYEDMNLTDKGSAKKTAYNALSEDEQKKVKAASKKVAEEALKKAQDGEDFSKLIKEYGWDPGMDTYTGGYYFTKDYSFVKEFIDGGFALKEGEISGLVESDYGYHILKRLPYDEDYVDSNIDTLLKEYNSVQLNKLLSASSDKLKVTYGDYYDKFTIDSIK